MKTRLRSAGAVAAVAALAASVLLATPGTAQAADTATITVSVVDQYGQPAAVSVTAYDQFGNAHFDNPPDTAPVISSTHVFQELPAGHYSFASQGPWSGLVCFGVDPCGAIGPGTTFTPVVTVAEGGAGSYAAKVVMPTVTGGPAVGTPLTVQTSQGYEFYQAFAMSQTGKSGKHTQQWLRDTSNIRNATGPSYTTTTADAAKQVSARLTPSPAMASMFGQVGYVVRPYTTRPVSLTKVPTRTKATFLGDVVRVKVKSLPGAFADGKVKLSLGKFKVKAKLKKGKAPVALPPTLAPGKYTLKASYPGSRTFEKSKSTKKTVAVG